MLGSVEQVVAKKACDIGLRQRVSGFWQVYQALSEREQQRAGIGMVHQVSQLVVFGGSGVGYTVKQRVGPLVSQQKGIAFAFIGNNASGRFSKSFATELVVSDNCWHIRPFVSLRIF